MGVFTRISALCPALITRNGVVVTAPGLGSRILPTSPCTNFLLRKGPRAAWRSLPCACLIYWFFFPPVSLSDNTTWARIREEHADCWDPAEREQMRCRRARRWALRRGPSPRPARTPPRKPVSPGTSWLTAFVLIQRGGSTYTTLMGSLLLRGVWIYRSFVLTHNTTWNLCPLLGKH